MTATPAHPPTEVGSNRSLPLRLTKPYDLGPGQLESDHRLIACASALTGRGHSRWGMPNNQPCVRHTLCSSAIDVDLIGPLDVPMGFQSSAGTRLRSDLRASYLDLRT